MTCIEHTSWNRASADVRLVRECVFVYEWRIPVEIEFDKADMSAEHVVLYEEEKPIATGRLCQDGYISRIAVIPSKRNTDAATRIFEQLKIIAQGKKITNLLIASDISHVDDCIKQGFAMCGKVYMEAGVARQKLSCAVDKFCPINWGWLH